MKLPGTISIGQLAKRTGLSVSAIRYYEQRGLVDAERNAGGQRRFLRSDIRRLSFVLIAQQFGFSIEEIRRELEKLPRSRTPTKRDWQRQTWHYGTLALLIPTRRLLQSRRSYWLGGRFKRMRSSSARRLCARCSSRRGLGGTPMLRFEKCSVKRRQPS